MRKPLNLKKINAASKYDMTMFADQSGNFYYSVNNIYTFELFYCYSIKKYTIIGPNNKICIDFNTITTLGRGTQYLYDDIEHEYFLMVRNKFET